MIWRRDEKSVLIINLTVLGLLMKYMPDWYLFILQIYSLLKMHGWFVTIFSLYYRHPVIYTSQW